MYLAPRCSLFFFRPICTSSSDANSTKASPLGRPSLDCVRWTPDSPPFIWHPEKCFHKLAKQIIIQVRGASKTSDKALQTAYHTITESEARTMCVKWSQPMFVLGPSMSSKYCTNSKDSKYSSKYSLLTILVKKKKVIKKKKKREKNETTRANVQTIHTHNTYRTSLWSSPLHN